MKKALFIVLIILFISCQLQGNPFIGTWTVGDGYIHSTVIFRSDGTFTEKDAATGIEDNGTYEYDETTITFFYDAGGGGEWYYDFNDTSTSVKLTKVDTGEIIFLDLL